MRTASSMLAVLLGIVMTGALFAQTPPAAPPAPAATTTPAAPATPAPPAAAPGMPAPPPAAAPAPPPPPPPPAAKTDSMEGLAAVYSDKLAGHKTASGQVFSQSKMTAAHPSLPFGTKVKVTNTKNNKSVEVTINDRGPTQPGRVMDISSSAAKKIGIGKKSMAPVKLEVMSDAPPKKAASKKSSK